MKTLNIENAKIRYANFSGRETEFNNLGNRNFCVDIEDEELAKQMIEEGWNIRTRENADGDVTYYTQIKVNFREWDQPVIRLITVNADDEIVADVALQEEEIGMLDNPSLEIRNIDLIINPSHWTSRNGKMSGIKGYLRKAYVTIVEDPFEHKYRR